jgi:UDP-2,3-diacylglucosamine hydrolase
LPFTAFISDLHLAAERPAATHAFHVFLRDVAPAADALYILGDLFEYWAGDDDLSDPFNARVVAALAAVVERIPVYLTHGNRDFLLLDGFARASGVRLLPDPYVLDLYGTRTLLMHGDLLCTDDRRYQAFRRVVRNRLVQRIALLLPLARRKALVGGARRMSTRETQAKSMNIMDVNQAAVASALRESGCGRLIHGHTHRPARHEHLVDARRCERWVLSDWYHHGQYLRVGPDACESIELPFA